MADLEQEVEQEEQVEELDPALEKTARDMGWRPKAEYKGKPEKWVDAETFVDKGEHVVPILRAHKEQLQKELLTKDKKLATLETELKDLREAVGVLNKGYSDVGQKEYENTRNQLKVQLKKAREEDDVDAELEIRDRLDKLKPPEPIKLREPDKKQTQQGNVTPENQAWFDENPWFGNQESLDDVVKTNTVLGIMEYNRKQGSKLVGREFMEEAMASYEKVSGKKEGKAADKYGSGTNRDTGSESRGAKG